MALTDKPTPVSGSWDLSRGEGPSVPKLCHGAHL